jgi:protein-tyrosine phosphatase
MWCLSPPSSLSRHVALDGQANFRDLGGYETIDGRRIAWRRVYRSGRLAMLGDADVALLEALGIKTIANLLTRDDVERHGPDRILAGAEEVSLAIESDPPSGRPRLSARAISRRSHQT